MNNEQVIISLEVQNGFEFPKQLEALQRELSILSTAMEEGPGYTDTDEFLCFSFEGEYHAVDDPISRTWVREEASEFSKKFPDLIFAMDVTADIWDLENKPILRRDYFCNGKIQTVTPYTVIPDYDPKREVQGGPKGR